MPGGEAVARGVGLTMVTQFPTRRQENPPVLLVRDGAGHWSELKAVLEAQSLPVIEVGRLRQAEAQLKDSHPPLVFTAVLLADGNWKGVLLLARKAGVPLIVVSGRMDMHFCLDVLRQGAFDFIVPPFNRDDIGYVVRNASGLGMPGPEESEPQAA